MIGGYLHFQYLVQFSKKCREFRNHQPGVFFISLGGRHLQHVYLFLVFTGKHIRVCAGEVQTSDCETVLVPGAISPWTVLIYGKCVALIAKGDIADVLEMGWVSVLRVGAQCNSNLCCFHFNHVKKATSNTASN